MKLKEQIAELEKLDAERTQGDWQVDDEYHCTIVNDDSQILYGVDNTNDLDFIANAPKMMQIIRELVKQNEEQQEPLEVAKEALELYAEDDSWRETVTKHGGYENPALDNDQGDIAKDALIELNKAMEGKE